MSVRAVQSDTRAVAIKAFIRLFEPLAQFAMDAGLSASELNSIFRHASVKWLADRQLLRARRVNISGISARTGIPRSEISRILRSNTQWMIGLQRPSIYRVITAWHRKSRFTDAGGQPLDLKIYGKGATFESLVRVHGAGIPLRAILDEMIRMGAVEIVPSQKVRAISASLSSHSLEAKFIKTFGDRAAKFMSNLLSEANEPDRVQRTVSGAATIPTGVPFRRKNLRRKNY